MKYYTLLIALLLFSFTGFAQFRISGEITQELDKAPLEGANIILKELNRVSVSGKDGTYNFRDIERGTYTLEVSFIGYRTISRLIDLTEDTDVSISLEEVPIMTDEVIVSATRAQEKTPMTFSVIDREDLEKQNFGQDIPFLLNQIPSSVSTSDAGAGIGYTYFRIRGSDATRVNVTINGIPLNDSESQGVFWVNLPDLTSSVENIQVQRGVGTSTNGPGAFGASINIQTNSYKEDPNAEFNTSFGSFNTGKHTLAVGSGLLNNHFTIDARLSKVYSDGYVDRATTDMSSYFASFGYYGESTLLKLNLISGKEKTYQAWWGVPESRLENDLEGMNNHITNNGLNQDQADNLLNSGRTYNYYTYDDETDNYKQDHYQLLFAQEISSKVNFSGAFFHTHGEGYFEQFREDDSFSDYGLNDVIIGIDTLTTTDLIRRRWLDNDLYGFNYSFEANPLSNLEVILGGGWSGYLGEHFGEIIWAEIAQGTSIRERFYDNTGEKDDFNTYLKASYNLNDRWFLYGDVQYRSVAYQVKGLDIDQRILDIDQSESFFNPKLGLTYTIKSGENVYVSYSIGNREPVRDDFIDAPAGRTPKPETLYNWEAGYKKVTSKGAFNVNFYYMDYKNQLVLTGELNDVGAGIRTNVESSHRMGLEVLYGMKLNHKFSFDLNASLSQNKIDEFEEVLYDYGINWDEYNEVRNVYKDTEIAFSPSVIAGGSFSYFPTSDFEITWLSKYVGKQYLDNTGNEDRTIDAFFVNDLRFLYSIKPDFMEEIGLSLLVNNIFNSLYESNGYTYGYIGGGVEIRENLFYPQAGTNFLASVSFSF
jgi:iron complex outermembrane receptor protein